MCWDMYNPPHFASTDLNWLDWLAEHHPFCTLVSQVDGDPFASHLPVLYTRTDDQVLITGHWARPNAQWRDIENQRVMLLFHGPHAYVSPRWYADAPKQVPTWNYVTAHVYGRLVVHDDPAWTEDLVRRLTTKHEAYRDHPWSVDDAPRPFIEGQLRAIVGIELEITRIEAKAKLSQNRPAADVEGVIAGLRERGDKEMADAVEEATADAVARARS